MSRSIPVVTCDVADWSASVDMERVAAGLPQAAMPHLVDAAAKPVHLPVMTARRLGSGDRLAVDSALGMFKAHPVDAVVFSNRHGELEHNTKILAALAAREPLSPSRFTMSVHNTAVGTATITGHKAVPSSSVAAGVDSFQQALFEVAAFFQAGCQCVLLTDFCDRIPDYYRQEFALDDPTGAYAVSLVLRPGNAWSCAMAAPGTATASDWPQSIQWLRHVAAQSGDFRIAGPRFDWHWRHHQVRPEDDS